MDRMIMRERQRSPRGSREEREAIVRIGMVGLGRMGGNMTARLLRAGHEVVAYARRKEQVDEAVEKGAVGAGSLAELVSELEAPRAVWVMVPAGAATDGVIDELSDLLTKGDVVVDGGNSRFTDSVARAEALSKKGISLIDSGTSGGIWGLTEGYCLMIGAEQDAFAKLEPIFESLAPENGYQRVGPPGAGHFAKMVHNGVEYGLLQAYAEGFDLLQASDFDFDLAQVAELWRHGSVVRSWLLDLAAAALADDPRLETVTGYVDDSGEGRWTVETAISSAVPTPVIAAALFARFDSRRPESFAMKVIAALRRAFGGHAVRGPER
jgi:6-phosphogluconate dehydrogenase